MAFIESCPLCTLPIIAIHLILGLAVRVEEVYYHTSCIKELIDDRDVV